MHIEEDVFRLVTSVGQRENYLLILLFYLQKQDAVDILAVCWTRVMYEFRNGPRPPLSLWGSVVHRSAEPKVWGSIPHEKSKLFNLSHAPDNTENIFLYFYRAQNLKFLQISYPTN